MPGAASAAWGWPCLSCGRPWCAAGLVSPPASNISPAGWLRRDRAQRAIAECRHLATMTEEPGRTTRRFLTPPIHDVHAHLRRRMVSLSMDVRVDGAGNLRGLYTPPNPGEGRLLLGSH